MHNVVVSWGSPNSDDNTKHQAVKIKWNKKMFKIPKPDFIAKLIKFWTASSGQNVVKVLFLFSY